MVIKETWYNLKNKIPYIPDNYRKWTSYFFFFFLVISMPIAVWGLTTGRFELRERAASFEPTPTPSNLSKFIMTTFTDSNNDGAKNYGEQLFSGFDIMINVCPIDSNDACVGSNYKSVPTKGLATVYLENMTSGRYKIWATNIPSGWYNKPVITGYVGNNTPPLDYNFELPLGQRPYPYGTPSPTPTPFITRTCTVIADKGTYNQGDSISIKGYGNVNTKDSKVMNVWLERVDGKPIQKGSLVPWPSVSWLNKYYRLARCESGNCIAYSQLTTLVAGKYYIFCDYDNTCSGGSGLSINPDISVKRCDVNNDRKELTINTPSPTPSPKPAGRSCTVDYKVEYTDQIGTTVNLLASGNANISGTAGINIWVERQDGKAVPSGILNPPPAVTWPPAPNTKYYRIGTCNSINKTACNISSYLSFKSGDYYIFCDINNTCSGGSGLSINPDITNAGIGRCDAVNDRKSFTVSQPMITPTPKPTIKPTIIPTPTVIPQPTATPTRVMWEGFSPQIYHTIGRKEGTNDWSANTAQDKPGYLNFGPYITTLVSGTRYRVSWTLLIDVANPGWNDQVATVEINDATSWKILGQKPIMRNSFLKNWAYQDFSIDFTYQAGQKLEFRSYWHQKAYIKLDKITVTKI